jgi:hypothetical protein
MQMQLPILFISMDSNAGFERIDILAIKAITSCMVSHRWMEEKQWLKMRHTRATMGSTQPMPLTTK